jgi:hypothetical protein
VVRGHGNAPHKATAATRREPTTALEVVAAGPPSPGPSRAAWPHVGLGGGGATIEKPERRRPQGAALQAAGEADAADDAALLATIARLPLSGEKRVVAYTLFGHDPKYVRGALRNAELVHVYFAGWTARFYCDATVPSDTVAGLQARGAEVVMDATRPATMFTRFLAAADPTVDRFIVRDADSRLNARERMAVEAWVQSGKGVHSIRDHPNHAKPLNGGLWGAKRGAIPNITGLIESYLDIKKCGCLLGVKL